MQDFVKVKIISCSDGQKYNDLIGDHGMATSVQDNKYYRIRNEEHPYILKKDCVPCNTIGRMF